MPWGLDRETRQTILFLVGLVLVLAGAVGGGEHWPAWLDALVPMLLAGTVIAKAKP